MATRVTPPRESAPSAEEDALVDLEFRWQNFRGFVDTSWLAIPPLTVLIGPNNSGKTTVLAPLLVMNQTMQSRDAGTPLVSRGPLFDAGNFQNLLTHHDANRELGFGVRFHVHDAKGKTLKKIGTYPPGAVELTFTSAGDPHNCTLTGYTVYDMYLRKVLARSLTKDGRYGFSGPPKDELTLVERKVLRESKPHHFLFNATLDLREFVPREAADEGPVRPDFSGSFSLYLSIVSYVFAEMRSMLDDMSYIGPVRERSRSFYPVTAEVPRSVGPAGERAANLLRQRFARLQPALDQWVRAFELGDAVKYRDLSADLFEIYFLSEGRETNIADAGFGASQVFPLIVQALASAPGTLTLAEQPEIHLNPKLQSVLADLFVTMANTHRRVVVETHSEHLLLRLRRLIAEGKIAANRVALYFVEKIGGESTIRRVPISAKGHISADEWPKGFFGETLKESLALAAAQAARK